MASVTAADGLTTLSGIRVSPLSAPLSAFYVAIPADHVDTSIGAGTESIQSAWTAAQQGCLDALLAIPISDTPPSAPRAIRNGGIPGCRVKFPVRTDRHDIELVGIARAAGNRHALPGDPSDDAPPPAPCAIGNGGIPRGGVYSRVCSH